MPSWIAAISSSESGLVRSTPSTSAAKHGPIWRVLTGIALASLRVIRPRSPRLPEVGDARGYPFHQQAQALVVPAGVVRVGRDREQRAEAAALLMKLVDLVRALRGIADDPDVL